MFKFDLHVAAESHADKNLEQALTDLGLQDDGLLKNYFNFHDSLTLNNPPKIRLHMSKKYDKRQALNTISKIRKDITQIEALMSGSHVTGYAHAELTHPKYDLLLTSNIGFNLHAPWPVATFRPVFSRIEHQWDIHVAIPIDELPAQMATILEQSGMYSIERLKLRDGTKRIFRVYTVQGTFPSETGRLLFDRLVGWFRVVNSPYVEIKMETYIAMVRIGEPTIVPPVVNDVQFVPNLQFEHA